MVMDVDEFSSLFVFGESDIFFSIASRSNRHLNDEELQTQGKRREVTDLMHGLDP